MHKMIRGIVTILALGLFILSGYKLFGIVSTYRSESQANEQLAEQFVQTVPPHTEPVKTTEPSSDETTATEPTASNEYAPIRVDFAALLEKNPHVIGWVYAPDTPISYPVVQTENNSDYLRAGLDGSYAHGGTVFLDYRCAGDLSGLNSIIYGHNLLDQTMFGTLERYKKQSYYDAHPTLYLLTPDGDYRVDLIAGLDVDANSVLYRIDHTEETYREFLREVLRQSDFQTAFPTDEITRTLTLSTCAYEHDDARYIVVGVLTPLDTP